MMRADDRRWAAMPGNQTGVMVAAAAGGVRRACTRHLALLWIIILVPWVLPTPAVAQQAAPLKGSGIPSPETTDVFVSVLVGAGVGLH